MASTTNQDSRISGVGTLASPQVVPCALSQTVPAFVCDVCLRAFPTKIGLGVHARRKHPSVANAKSRPKDLKTRWSSEESRLLARREAELQIAGCRFPNQALDGFLPGRSFDSLKSHRKNGAYKALVAEYVSSIREESSQVRVSTPVIETSSSSQSESNDSYVEMADWTPGKMREVANSEILLFGTRCINIELCKLFPGHSPTDFRTLRKRKEYKTILANLPSVVSDPADLEIAVNNPQERQTSLPDTHVTSPLSGSTKQNPDARTLFLDSPSSAHTDLMTSGHFAASQTTSDALSSNSNIRLVLQSYRDVGISTSLPIVDDLLASALGNALSLTELDDFLKNLFPNKRGTSGHPHMQLRTSPSRGDRPALSRRATRRQRFAQVQDLYRKDRKKCSSFILDGEQANVSFSSKDFHSAWSPLYSSEAASFPSVPENTSVNVLTAIWGPISLREIELNMLPARTSAGPDGITSQQLRSTDRRILHILLNIFMLLGDIPNSLTGSRTTFIPKEEKPKSPLHFRPISVSSVILRLYHKILASRLREEISWNCKQRAFVAADGTFENVQLLRSALKHSHLAGKNLFLASLDLRKAFDSVSHAAVLHALQRLGCPPAFLDYMSSYLAKGYTTLLGSDGLSDPVPLRTGVRQGDPLSPLCFNAVVDNFLSSLPPEVGFVLGETSIDSSAFADDITLFASSGQGLQTLIDKAASFFSERNLFVNAEKSFTLSIRYNGKMKKSFIDSDCVFRIDGSALPTLGAVSTFKYLGVTFTTSGNIPSPTTELGKLLDNVRKAPLKPQQRLFILRTFLLPRLHHLMTLSDVSVGTLNVIDKTVRKAVKAWLRLPNDTPKGFFHAKGCDGGLGIQTFRFLVPSSRLRRMLQLQSSGVPHLREVGKLTTFQADIRKAEKACSFNGRDIFQKKNSRALLAEHLHSSNDGVGLTFASDCQAANRWVTDGTSLLSGKDFIMATKLRINALPTAQRTARGRSRETRCRAGCDSTETLAHVLQSCSRTHTSRVKRHDNVVRLVTDRLRPKCEKLLVEPHFTTNEGLRKPDIVLKCNGTGVVIDVQVISDRANLLERHNRKVNYYANNESLQEIIKSELDCTTLRFSSVTINWRGVVCSKSADVL